VSANGCHPITEYSLLPLLQGGVEKARMLRLYLILANFLHASMHAHVMDYTALSAPCGKNRRPPATP